MKTVKTYKYPMFLDKKQEKILNSWIEKGKWIYNYLLQVREADDFNRKQHPEKYADFRKKHVLKNGVNAGKFSWERANSNIIQELQEKYPDLREIPATCLTTINEQVKQAYDAYFQNLSKLKTGSVKAPRGGFKNPREKGPKDDFSLHQRQKNGFALKANLSSARVFGFPKIAIGKKSKGLKINYFRPIEGTMKQQRIVKEGAKWFLLVVAEKIVDAHLLSTEPNTVGIDLGVKRWIQKSDGTYVDLPPQIDKLRKKEKKLQRGLRRKVGGNKRKGLRQSKNYKKAYQKVAKISAKIARIRDYHIKMNAENIAKSYDVICVESLKVKNMTKSAKGTKDVPGKNVKQKSGLNRVILESAPFMFKTYLKNKAKEYGKVVVEVPAAYTSQMCSACGHVHEDNRLTQESFKCMKCNFELNADHNAALNIKKIGLKRYKNEDNA